MVTQHKGLRGRIGGASKNLSMATLTEAEPLRIYKNGVKYNIWTVDPGDPWASPIRLEIGGNVKAIRYLTAHTDTPHTDWTDHSDSHTDHSDAYADWTNVHTDSHDDHSDEPYVDEHTDAGHTDDHTDWNDHDNWTDYNDWTDEHTDDYPSHFYAALRCFWLEPIMVRADDAHQYGHSQFIPTLWRALICNEGRISTRHNDG